jgi:hypothetical protein
MKRIGSGARAPVTQTKINPPRNIQSQRAQRDGLLQFLRLVSIDTAKSGIESRQMIQIHFPQRSQHRRILSQPSAKQHMRRRPFRSLQMLHNCLAIARECRFGFERI